MMKVLHVRSLQGQAIHHSEMDNSGQLILRDVGAELGSGRALMARRCAGS